MAGNNVRRMITNKAGTMAAVIQIEGSILTPLNTQVTKASMRPANAAKTTAIKAAVMVEYAGVGVEVSLTMSSVLRCRWER